MLVRDVMSRDPATVREDTTVKQALTILADRRVTSLPVVAPAGAVVGVVSEADLIRDLLPRDPGAHPDAAEEPDDRPVLVLDVMTPHPVTLHPDTDLVEAVDVLTSTTIKSAPVVDGDGTLLGMLSRADVVRFVARQDTRIEAEVDDLLRSSGLDGWLVEVREGAVELSGPPGPGAGIARMLAETVAGAVRVTVVSEE